MSKHIVDCTKEGMTYKDIPEMSRYNVAISTQVHNHIARVPYLRADVTGRPKTPSRTAVNGGLLKLMCSSR